MKRNSFMRVVALNVVAVHFLSPASCRADTLYVSCAATDTIECFDLATGTNLGVWGRGLAGPTGLAVDRAGNLYVANNYTDTIMKFAPTGAGTVFVHTARSSPYGLAFDHSGNLYAATADFSAVTGYIEKFTPNGVGSIFANTGPILPLGLAFDGNRNLYVANSDLSTPQDRIERITPAGMVSTFATSGLNCPYGLTFDSLGNLYVANLGNSTIERFAPDGRGSPFASVVGGFPIGLACDQADNLYAAITGFDGSIFWIEKYSADGVPTIFAYTASQPFFIAIQQIPEPSVGGVLVFGGLLLLACKLERFN